MANETASVQTESSFTASVPAPFTVVVDSREQAAWTFRGLTAGARHGRAPLIVPTVVKGLASGDYSVEGMESQVAIERKSPGDLFATLTFGRQRFENELERLSELAFSAVVIEAEFATLAARPPTRMTPRSFVGSVVALQQRFPRTHWMFAGSRMFAEGIAYRMLERYHRDHDPAAWKPKRGRKKAATS